MLMWRKMSYNDRDDCAQVLLNPPDSARVGEVQSSAAIACANAATGAPRGPPPAWLRGSRALEQCHGHAMWLQVATQILSLWASTSWVQAVEVKAQAALTHSVLLVLSALGRDRVDSTPGLLGYVLNGVSTRLGSPDSATRKQVIISWALSPR